MDAFLAASRERTEIDMSFRLRNLPAELQMSIAELAVYEDSVIGLGNCEKAPYRSCSKRTCSPISSSTTSPRIS